MQILELLIIIIISVLLFLCIYKIQYLSSRLSRLSGRYNTLLRGRGEMNMEDLIAQLSEDVDMAIDKVQYMESISDALQASMEKSTNTFAKELSTNINNVDTSISSRIDTLEDRYNHQLGDMSSSLNSKIDRVSRTQEEFAQDLKDTTDRRINAINDQMAFSVQKVVLHKYDAFEHQTGKLSFTMVLLDRFNSGIMMTSINGRDQSYTYSKYIKNGKSELEMSPDEQDALNMLINNK